MMKRKVLAAMALAVTISAVPLTAYASATVSDSTSVNTESQVNSESQDSVATPTPASGDASTPTPEPSTAVEPETSPDPTTTVTPAPTETPAATEVPASAETPSQSPTEAPTTTPTETPEQPEYKAGWNSVDVEGKKQWFFYDAEAKAPKTGLFTEGDKTYLAAADTGYLLTGVQSIEENGTVHTYYFSEEGGQPGTDSAYGTRVTGLAADGKYYEPDLAVNKLIQVNGGTYYAGADGTFVKDGFGTVGEKTYYFDKEGKLFTGEGWITVQDQTYYIVKDNNQESVVCKDGNEESTDEKTSWLKLDGSWYLLDRADGHRLTGLQKNENDLYYLDPAQEGKMFTSTNQEDGWLNLDGTWYFFRGWGGALNNGWNKLGNDWYWFHEDCSMGSAEWIDDGENLYYVRDWGGMLHDQWRQENGIWYYFRGWGAALNNGWSKIGNDWYWFNSDCTMASAQWIEEGGNLYYVRDWGGMLHDQWRQENGVWYYFRGWGAALNNGWSKIGNDWYWFNSDCKMASSQWLQQGENWYYLRDWGGRLHSGEFVVDGETYYFNADGVLTDKKELSQVIVIDPGHQGQGDSRKEPVGPGSSVMKARVTSGTTGCVSGLDEYELNLQVSLLLRTELESRGYTVYMTRETHDVNISNKERAEYASSVGGDILVRIHANGDDNSSVNGALCMAPSDSNAFVSALAPESQRLSQCIIDSYCQATGLRNRGVMITDDMSGINWSTMPVTIVEMGFMSNAGDDSKMADSDFQKKMVDGIADGIDQYFQ